MDFNEFLTLFRTHILPEMVFDNPGGGTSTVLSISENNVVKYRRGTSSIYINIRDMYDAYKEFRGQRCHTGNLKKFRPNVYSSSAHPCNCTFLFLILKEMRLCGKIGRDKTILC